MPGDAAATTGDSPLPSTQLKSPPAARAVAGQHLQPDDVMKPGSNNDKLDESMDDSDQMSPFAALSSLRDDSGTFPAGSPAAATATAAATAAASTGPAGSRTAGPKAPVTADKGSLGGDDAVAGHLDGCKGVGSGGGAAALDPQQPPVNFSVKSIKKKRLIPLKQVLRDSYEYHGLNDLAMFCITAMSVTLVLYWHWGQYTAIFKAGVQRSFQSYGNPDWQSQSMVNVDTMNDAVEYSTGWLEFWLSRADALNWTNDVVRAGEYGDLRYVRMLVNIDGNCADSLSPYLECYSDSPLTTQLQQGAFGGKFENILEYSGWQRVELPRVRDMSYAGQGMKWWSYAMVAPLYGGRNSTRDDYIGRMYNVTRNSCLNINNCDWLATSCLQTNATHPNPCDDSSDNVPFNNWFGSDTMCNGTLFPDLVNGEPVESLARDGTVQNLAVNGSTLQRGQRYFVHNPQSAEPGQSNVLDLKPFLAKYAYSIVLDVLAANAMGDGDRSDLGKHGAPDRDRAVFSMAFQRSAVASGKPDRVLWQITSTVPVRTSFYTYSVDWTRIGFEAMLYLCMIFVLFSQAWQFRVCKIQFRSWKPFFAHYWNDYEVLSTLVTVAWIVYYWILIWYLSAESPKWHFDKWDMLTSFAHQQLNSVVNWSYAYSAWLYMGIVVDFLIFLRIARYMRIHVGLKAFYQVFIIAGRECLDFAVFLLFILVLLGSAVFAFFQLTGGNYQFLRFADGLSVMTRLTFGFLSYEDFQAQALGVGAAVSAVTLLFWVAVLLLVVYTQNIILAIVAEAYEEAKAKLGTAETSFLMLILMRLLFFLLYVLFRVRMFCVDVHRLFTGQKQLAPSSNVRQVSGLPPDSPHPGGSSGGADDDDGKDPGDGPAAASGPKKANSTVRWHSSSDGIDARQDDSYQTSSPYAAASQLGGGGGGHLPTLMSSASVYGVLPRDVEAQLRQAPSSFISTSRKSSKQHRPPTLLSRGRAASSPAPAAGADAAVESIDTEAAVLTDGVPSDGQENKSAATLKEMREQQMSMGHRWRSFWYNLTTERHDVRMYKDLLIAPKKGDDGWIAAWKRRYWAPWCVARTAPVKRLMYLYQDFTSYKLKVECTWKEAHTHGEEVFKASADGMTAGCRDDACVFRGLPPLTEDSFVDEATLARLFLVSSMMSKDVRMLFSPFKPLTSQSVGYLVRGISEVYGIDVDDDKLQLAQAWKSYAVMPGPAGSGSTSGSITLDLRDAALGQATSRRPGGFISHLNQKRREGENNSKQLLLLSHAQRRLEEMGHRTERQLAAYRNLTMQQANHTEMHLKEQGQQNRELLKSVQALQAAVDTLHAAAPAAAAGSGGGGGFLAERVHSSKGRPSSASESGAAGAISSAAAAVNAARAWAGRKTPSATPVAALGAPGSSTFGKKGGPLLTSLQHRGSSASSAASTAAAVAAAAAAAAAVDAGCAASPGSDVAAVHDAAAGGLVDAGRGDGANDGDTEKDDDFATEPGAGPGFSRCASAVSRASALSGGSASSSQAAAGLVGPEGQMLLQLQQQMDLLMQMLQARAQQPPVQQ